MLNPAIPAMFGTRRACLSGTVPNPLNSLVTETIYSSANLIGVRCCFRAICDSPDFQNLAGGRKKRRNGVQPQMATCEIRENLW